MGVEVKVEVLVGVEVGVEVWVKVGRGRNVLDSCSKPAIATRMNPIRP